MIVLANLAEAEVEAISCGVAGLIEPALRAPHLGPAAGSEADGALPTLLAALVRGDSGTRVTPALADFLLPSAREAFAELAVPSVRWTFAGCDEVAGKGIERLGELVARICDARGDGPDTDHLAEVSYTAGGEVAFLDWYDY